MRFQVDSVRRVARDRRLVDLADRLSGWLLPPRCALCGAGGQVPCLDLCAACQRSLPAAGQSLLVGPWPLGSCFAPFDYEYPLAHLVHALKYRGQLAVGRVLGTLLVERIATAGLLSNVEVLLPVPLHPARYSSRGYNHSTEIARWMARRLGCRLEPRLATRHRATRPQVGLSPEQRRQNLSGAFVAGGAVRGRHITVVDDVTTTGSTLRALASALLDAGATGVDAWCIARAGRGGIPSAARVEPSPGAAAMR